MGSGFAANFESSLRWGFVGLRPPFETCFHRVYAAFLLREGEATALNMFLVSLHNEFVAWEGEAPAEPLHRRLGKSLALP